MSLNEKLMEQVKALLVERSKRAIELAKQAVLQEQLKYEPLNQALKYFMEEIWYNAAHPALLSLSCEAVGGDPEATTNISAALVVLTGAADIHDDIIDQSVTKESKLTVFGKYGRDIAIIVGDILWFKGMLMLSEACEAFSTEKKQLVLKLAKQSFYDIGSVEAKEAGLRRNLDLQPQEYLEIIKVKVSVAEAAARIGAIIGNGNAQQIETLAQYGRTLGNLMTIRDEFIDMFEIDEMKNRYNHECLPLPILYAFQDKDLKSKITKILGNDELSEQELDKILEIVVNAPQVHQVAQSMNDEVETACQRLSELSINRVIFTKLLKSTLDDLPF